MVMCGRRRRTSIDATSGVGCVLQDAIQYRSKKLFTPVHGDKNVEGNHAKRIAFFSRHFASDKAALQQLQLYIAQLAMLCHTSFEVKNQGCEKSERC